DWLAVSGRVRMNVDGRLDGFHVGDEVEAVGWMERPQRPANPGEFDRSAYARDRRLRAELHVRKAPETVARIAEGNSLSGASLLARLRGWGQRALRRSLPAGESGVAEALLLGDGAPMTTADWDRYVRTGVVHVLAISGQHLAVLALFAWFVLRLFGVRRKYG